LSAPGAEEAAAIAASGLTIYDDLTSSPELLYSVPSLEARLQASLVGLDLGYPLRTRSVVAKAAVARSLGYPVPKSFRRVRPRFPGQNVDVFVQKSDNLQVWNEELEPSRRYVLLRVGADDKVTDVRVLTGEALALLDRTGTLTSKYQAKRKSGRSGSHLVVETDTQQLIDRLQPSHAVAAITLASQRAADLPVPGAVLSVAEVARRLFRLVGSTLHDPGVDQERLRGAGLQRLVCESLGLRDYSEMGQFPDIRSQALEVKLQTSSTIDLGLVSPDSGEPAAEIPGLSHRDVRYAVVFAAPVPPREVSITAVVVTTGAAFFDEFQRFEGRVKNTKLQIPLPKSLFEQSA